MMLNQLVIAAGNKIMLDDKILFHSCWEVLGLIMQQKKMISLDQNFFQSFMKSLLSSRSNLLVPQDLDKRSGFYFA